MVRVVTSSKQRNKAGDRRGLHPNTLANLEKSPAPIWEPGQSGHIQGESLKGCLQRLAEKPLVKPDPKTAPAKEQIAYATLEGAVLREPTPFKEAWERLEGKVPEKHLIAQVDVVFIIGKGYQEKLSGET